MTALEAVPARLARDGERVLCGRVRPGVSPCSPDLGTYFGRDGGDPLAWAVELAPNLRPVLADGVSTFEPRPGVRPRVRQRDGGRDTTALPLHRYRIQFSDVPDVRVRCRECRTVSVISGEDLVRQYADLVQRGRLTTSR